MGKHRKPPGNGRSKGPTRKSRASLGDTFVSQGGHDAPETSQFSLREAALNTERHHGGWSAEKKLRHNRVTFVRPTTAEQQQPLEDASPAHSDIARSSDAFAQMDLRAAESSAASSSDSDVEITLDQDATSADGFAEDGTIPFVVDVTGSALTPQTYIPPPIIRSTSPSLSDSSDEVVFTGRSGRIVADPLPCEPKPPSQQPASTPGLAAWDSAPVRWVSRSQPGVGWINTGGKRARKRIRKRKSWQANKDDHGEDEDEAVADYLANLQGQDEAAFEQLNNRSIFGQRSLSLNDGNEWVDESDSSVSASQTQRKSSGTRQGGWESPFIGDFDNLSTSHELAGAVERILSKRERKQGLQYLVVYEGYTVDDARWIPSTSLTTENDSSLVHAFEQTLVNQILQSDDSEGEFSSEDDGSSSEEEDRWKDEEDLRQRKIERMTDEKIARILAKQEELGMGSAEILLFDDDDEEDDIYAQDESALNAILQPSRRRFQGSRRAKGEYPSASLMADVLEHDPYNGFDIMDFDRPSLRKKPKGRRGELPFELSDEELAANLQSTWEADRKKKRVRKQEREELRAMGLLGKKNKFKPDLKAKYNEGMTLAQVKEEIQWFLDSSHASYALPPMAARERHVVHEIANAFNIKSKSKGAGDARFTTLIRTSRTLEFDERVFTRMERGLLRRFLPRLDRPKRSAAAGPGRARGGANSAAVTYRNGDVVGGGAPEISAENRGRTMLEKMGWSTGTALGALNNKGILQPVTHVVKTNKAGLG